MKQKLSQLSVLEIKKQIHNLTVKKCRLNKSINDPTYDERERKRKRKVYRKFSESRIQTQMKWNKKNRVKTRKYNKKCYDKNRDEVLKKAKKRYKRDRVKILAARRKKK